MSDQVQVVVSKVRSQDPDAATVEGILTSKAESTEFFSTHSVEQVGELLKDFSNQMINILTNVNCSSSNNYNLSEIQIKAAIKFDGKLSIYILSGEANVAGEINFVFRKCD